MLTGLNLESLISSSIKRYAVEPSLRSWTTYPNLLNQVRNLLLTNQIDKKVKILVILLKVKMNMLNWTERFLLSEDMKLRTQKWNLNPRIFYFVDCLMNFWWNVWMRYWLIDSLFDEGLIDFLSDMMRWEHISTIWILAELIWNSTPKQSDPVARVLNNPSRYIIFFYVFNNCMNVTFVCVLNAVIKTVFSRVPLRPLPL